MENKNLFALGIILGVLAFFAGPFFAVLILLINHFVTAKRLPKDYGNAALLWILPLIAVIVNLIILLLMTEMLASLLPQPEALQNEG